MGKKRILFGAVDIGYRIAHYTKFIERNLSDQFEAESFSKYVLPESHYKTTYTYTCPIDKVSKPYMYGYTLFFFIYALFRYDVFHFLSGETILTRKLRPLEMWLYRFFGKRLVMHFVGADIRSVPYLDWKREHLREFLAGLEKQKLTEEFQDELVADTVKYADAMLVSSPDLLEILPQATFFPVLADLDHVLSHPRKGKEKIGILFSPSSHRTKGSSYVHEIMDRVAERYKDQVELFMPGAEITHQNQYPLTRYEILGLLDKVHIVIDQMLIGWYGLKSVEALLKGCEVICYIEAGLEKHLFPESPIHSADINSLEKCLSDLIEELMQNKLKIPPKTEWVKRYHTIEENNSSLLSAWGIRSPSSF